MQFCKGYSIPIINVISLTKDSHEKFCNKVSRDEKVEDSELSFGEILNKELEKQNKGR